MPSFSFFFFGSLKHIPIIFRSHSKFPVPQKHCSAGESKAELICFKLSTHELIQQAALHFTYCSCPGTGVLPVCKTHKLFPFSTSKFFPSGSNPATTFCIEILLKLVRQPCPQGLARMDLHCQHGLFHY